MYITCVEIPMQINEKYSREKVIAPEILIEVDFHVIRPAST